MSTIEQCQPSATPCPAEGRSAIRVFVAEDHKITLWGLQRLIEASEGRMRVAGIASSRSELLAHPALPQTDVILLDLDLAGEDSTESLAELRQRTAARILVLTAGDDARQHRAVVMKGARGLLHKSEPADTILNAIEKVHQGQIWLRSSLLGEVLGVLTGAQPAAPERDPHADRLASLTRREREIVSVLLANAGAKLFTVADLLALSEHTLRNHLTTIYGKLQVRGRLELHVYASEHGFMPLVPSHPVA